MRDPLVAAIVSKGYGTPEMCTTDNSLNVLRRESDSGKSDGWSKVVSKKAAPNITATTSESGSNNPFSALGSGKVTLSRKKQPEKIKIKKEAVVDDWETAELAEEEKERVTSGGSGDEEEEDVVHSPALTPDIGLGSHDEDALYERETDTAENELIEAKLDADSESEEQA